MTEHDALLAAIISSPKDDTPRMIYADWLEDRGEVERAEFIRLGVKAAESGCVFAQGWEHKCSVDERGYWTCQPHRLRCIDMLEDARFRNSVIPECFSVGSGCGHAATGSGVVEFAQGGECEFHRGFVSTITLSWADFLRHHASLIWSPRQTTECRYLPVSSHAQCDKCSGTGRITRPFVPTAQPIETVRLTTWPAQFTEYEAVTNIVENSAEFYSAPLQDGTQYRFDRVKCGTCGGDGYVCDCDPDGCETCFCSDYPCEDCERRPLNLWRCDAWPDQVFVMPGGDQA